MSNPALRNNPAFSGRTLTAEELSRIYNQPAADVQRPGIDPYQPPVPPASATPMTYENTIHKTGLLLLTVVVFAAIGWMVPALMLPGLIAGLVLGLINAFKREPNVALIIFYAVAQGLFLGGVSGVLEGLYPGIVSQAVIGTISVFAVTLLLFRSGKVRTSPKMTKIVLIAMLGYLVFSVVNVGLMWTGVSEDAWGLRTGVEIFGIPLGVLLGILAVFLAAYSLVMDFEFVKNGVDRGADKKYGWSAAFGLTVTLIWLYFEILRILAILRGD